VTTTLFKINSSSHGGQNEDKTLLQRSQPCHKGEFRHVSISARQRSLRCGQNIDGPFLRATLPDRALERWQTTGRQKGSYLHLVWRSQTRARKRERVWHHAYTSPVPAAKILQLQSDCRKS